MTNGKLLLRTRFAKCFYGESVHDGYPGEMILLEIIISLSLDVFLAAVVQAVMFYSNYLPLSRMVLVGVLLSWDFFLQG